MAFCRHAGEYPDVGLSLKGPAGRLLRQLSRLRTMHLSVDAGDLHQLFNPVEGLVC